MQGLWLFSRKREASLQTNKEVNRMKAMIFAAGLGTRLQPITTSIPKALVKVRGKALLEHAIEKLKLSGIDEIIINVHHFPDQIIAFINSKSFGIPIQISDERNLLLNTGGGLKKAATFFDKNAFLVYNVDIISDIDLSEPINVHLKNKAVATLVVRDRDTKRYLLFDENNILCGWKNIETGEQIIVNENKEMTPLAFSGIHIIDPLIFDLMPDDECFSMIDLYLEIAKFHTIKAFNDKNSNWMDVGKIEQLEQLNDN